MTFLLSMILALTIAAHAQVNKSISCAVASTLIDGDAYKSGELERDPWHRFSPDLILGPNENKTHLVLESNSNKSFSCENQELRLMISRSIKSDAFSVSLVRAEFSNHGNCSSNEIISSATIGNGKSLPLTLRTPSEGINSVFYPSNNSDLLNTMISNVLIENWRPRKKSKDDSELNEKTTSVIKSFKELELHRKFRFKKDLTKESAVFSTKRANIVCK